MSFLYLASPYSHPDPAVMEERYLAACDCVAALTERGVTVYSPVVHYHAVAVLHNLPRSFDFWSAHNNVMLHASRCTAILQLPGWDVSIGVASEREQTLALCKNVHYLNRGFYDGIAYIMRA